QYLMLKDQKLASQKDVQEVMEEVEGLKQTIQNIQTVELQKREWKYKALLSSLNLIDAHLSHTLSSVEKQKIDKQYASTQDARVCYNNLMLSCENTNIIKLFTSIMFGPKQHEKNPEQQTAILSQYRQLVREELGFDTREQSDEEKTWIRHIISEKTNDIT
ncbi:MAG: hypothetical protein ACRC9X_00475, partial [Bacteroidales bacterium]